MNEPPEGRAPVTETSGGVTLRGLGVSPGLAAGPVCRMEDSTRLLDGHWAAAEPHVEAGTAVRALEQASRALAELAERAAEPEARAILEAQSFIAADPLLQESVRANALDGMHAPDAITAACAHHREALVTAGGYFAERAADLDDIRNRAIAAARNLPMSAIPDPGHPFVLVADDLSPADTITLDPATVLAVITEKGGPTSHTAILARARGVPAVVACRGARELRDGTRVAVDGALGEVRTGVGEAEAAEVRWRSAEIRARLRASAGPGRTADGHPVKLLLNIGSAADLDTEVSAEGVGLFRTEFLFLDRRSAPEMDEQVAAYEAVFRALPGDRVVVRTLDAGTDKPLPFLGLPEETNPALGVRGLRVVRARPDVLDTQLDAIAAAARATGVRPWVMAPMVTTVAEVADFARRARSRGIVDVGAMVEVPAAALRASRLLAELDFLSIGTNDLSQYTCAVDRQHGELADLLDPWQPALLRLVAECADAGRRAGKPVGVCGEAAADPLLAPVLAGLGVTSLSMSALSVPAVREALAGRTLAECERAARSALEADDPAEARSRAG
ncbi:phosphoenolpyruvate--protein phosphotransferase [Microtetraspora sp. NBRC 16547]|uniref:phosphoenolpyruvate--protein phosphotransferase n=1 Tax=Microtetraspora sp. NBRC 16547 TaxID=3030993 RepID=UPI0024A5725C|nr:phosphoenolpyruvate--protein phosphotransferase [Microtetraspora sp. NBRC 16547]GLX01486.1 phosphoenolpyruvate-protein phosphotransferase [Microtetraspora sp. NBRC 16547]